MTGLYFVKVSAVAVGDFDTVAFEFTNIAYFLLGRTSCLTSCPSELSTLTVIDSSVSDSAFGAASSGLSGRSAVVVDSGTGEDASVYIIPVGAPASVGCTAKTR